MKVFDASENVVTARENALDYWVNEMPKNKEAKIVVYVPFQTKQDADDLTFDPFIIFSSGGRGLSRMKQQTSIRIFALLHYQTKKIR